MSVFEPVPNNARSDAEPDLGVQNNFALLGRPALRLYNCLSSFVVWGVAVGMIGSMFMLLVLALSATSN